MVSAVTAALSLLIVIGSSRADSLPRAAAAGLERSGIKAGEKAGEKSATADPRDALREADKRLRGMYSRVAGIQKAHDVASARRDGVQVSCVMHQEARARVVLQMAQEANAALAKAAAENHVDERTYLASRLVMLDDMSKATRRAAEICVEEELSTIQVQKVEVQIDTGEETSATAAGTTLQP